MEEVVIGSVVGATVSTVLQNLLSFPAEEISLLRNFNKDVEELKQSFVTIRDFLEDAAMKQVTDKPVKCWLRKLEDVAFDADIVFDELNYRILRKKLVTVEKTRTIFSTYSNPLAFRLRMSQRIKDIKNELRSINEEAIYLGLQVRYAGSSYGRVDVAEDSASFETDSFTTDRIFVGRDNDVRKIVDMLLSSPVKQVVSVFPILGMGGLGKTTLARTVYNNEKIVSHFESCFKEFFSSLTGENAYGSREVVLQKLQKSLGDKRYLLVLDNVWNEDPEKWDSFISSLEGISPVKGNVILVTTRSGNVATLVKTSDIHELGVLSEEDCWFIAKAFGAVEFGTIGVNIARSCRGLPLAAKVVGSLLRGKPKEEWLSIQKSWNLNFGGVGSTVLNILKLSFDNLPSPSLKKCFAYCSIFPKGSRMRREELIELWMAEGLCQTDREDDMEMKGYNDLNLLIQSSLLQVVRKDCYENVEYCIMHDLVHDLALSILNPKSLDDSYHHQVRYVFPISLADESSPITEKQVRCLRTLFFNGKLPSVMFSKFESLHVLILYNKDVKELSVSIGKLISLRYLDISHTRIECLPDSIGELYHFQTLRATKKHGGTSYLRKLPKTIMNLINLRHLHIPNIELPHAIGRLASLRTLPYFQVSNEKGHGIAELGKLKNLRGELEIHNLEKIRDREEAKSAYLFHKRNLSKLKFVWKKSKESETDDEDVLEGLQPHPYLKSLEINGFAGKRFPLWTLRMAVRDELEDCWARLDNLIEIKLSDCEECEEIPMMGHLKHLKFLYLYNLTNLKSMGSTFYGIQERGCNEVVIAFPSLERLELVNLTNLTSWASSETQPHEVSVFCHLEYLKVINCRRLTSAPSHFPSLKDLEIDKMESVLPLQSICGSNLTSLTKLKINRLQELLHLPNELFYNNQDLVELDITNCNNLTHLVQCFGGGGASLRKIMMEDCRHFTELPNDLYSLNSLEVLTIWRCPNLKSIPYPRNKQPSSLRELEICYCVELINLPTEMLESCMPSLEGLWLMGSESLTNLPEVINLLQEMPHLTKLRIEKVPQFNNIAAKIGSLRGLQELGFGGSSDTTNYASFSSSLNDLLPVLQSLRVLALRGRQRWVALPDQLQHLTTLGWLYLSDFGIESLPEWLGNLSSLKSLELFNCSKLRSLPSKKAMLGLTKLNDLNISWCQLLRQRLEEEEAGKESEWFKISHITYIRVDGRRFSAQ